MINVNYISVLKSEINVDNKGTTNISNVEKSESSFKDVLDSKTKIELEEDVSVDKKGVVKVEEKVEELVADINEKINSLNEKIDEGADDEVIAEELIELLGWLNIQTTDIKTLPVEISEEGLIKLIDKNINNIVSGDLEVAMLEQIPIDDKNTDITKISEIILKLLGEEVSKENIITALKKKVDIITAGDDNSEVISKKDVVNSKSTDLNKEAMPTMVIREENVVKVEDEISVTSKEVSEEDKVLSKLLGDDTKNISGLLNRFEAKSNVMNSSKVEGTSVFEETMDKDIIKNVKFMVKNAIQELKVKIYPKELGELTIKILSEEGIMRSEIKATSKETYNLLNSNIDEIKKSLSNENIKIQEVNIGLYSEDTTYFSGRGFEDRKNDNREQGTNSTMGFNDEGEEIIEELNNESNVDLLA